ncbi:MAG TPA: peptidoglycan-associated lipoprotein Pal [Bryobacteraceae bacterium]|nr:peptidoglycan-associated lipoprotein Pal [Bryobacteraceae bacterium]
MRARILTVIATIALASSGVACKKKVATAAPPAPRSHMETAAAPASAPHNSAASEPRQQQTAAAPRYPDSRTLGTIQELMSRIEDAYFDYDKHTIRPDAEKALKQDASTLAEIVRQYPDFHMTIEGHCDERGSEEYNMALGDARAKAVQEFLVTSGFPAAQLHIVSYGKDRPFCTEHNEECWQKNRRAHLVAMAQNTNSNTAR